MKSMVFRASQSFYDNRNFPGLKIYAVECSTILLSSSGTTLYPIYNHKSVFAHDLDPGYIILRHSRKKADLLRILRK